MERKITNEYVFEGPSTEIVRLWSSINKFKSNNDWSIDISPLTSQFPLVINNETDAPYGFGKVLRMGIFDSADNKSILFLIEENPDKVSPWQELIKQHFSSLRYYYRTTILGDSIYTNDTGKRYFNYEEKDVHKENTYAYVPDPALDRVNSTGFYTQNALLSIFRNLFHNKSLTFEQIKDLDEIRDNHTQYLLDIYLEDDKVWVNGSKEDDLPLAGAKEAAVEFFSNFHNEQKVSVNKDDFSMEKFPSLSGKENDFICGGDGSDSKSVVLYRIKAGALKDGIIEMPDEITSVKEDCLDKTLDGRINEIILSRGLTVFNLLSIKNCSKVGKLSFPGREIKFYCGDLFLGIFKNEYTFA